jgi:hypothetical protein
MNYLAYLIGKQDEVDHSVRRLTGVFGLAIVVLNWAMFPLYMVSGPAPQFQDTARFIT